jgi:hypothetical protein
VLAPVPVNVLVLLRAFFIAAPRLILLLEEQA